MDWMEIMAVLSATSAVFGVFLLLHVLLWRVPGLPCRGFVLMGCIAAVVYALAAFGLRQTAPPARHAWVSAPWFLVLLLLYMHFYAGILRSVSIRIAGELARADQGGLRPEELAQAYPPRGMVRERVDFLVETGWLAEKDGCYECTPKGARMAKLAVLLTRFYRINIGRS